MDPLAMEILITLSNNKQVSNY